LTVTLPAPDLPSGARTALVVATSEYSDAQLGALRAPAHDAEDLVSVLGDPDLGGFTVIEVRNAGVHSLRVAIDEYLATRVRDETALVYLSCHGVLTARRRLYFAAADTKTDRLPATALDSRWLNECLDDCRARRQVVILDCCFSGAFALAKGPEDVDLENRFGEAEQQGRGRVVLTASRATEYSFEGAVRTQREAGGSVFTAALLDGLRTGNADGDHDGLISVADAYSYAYTMVRESGTAQTPQKWVFGGEGHEVILTRSPLGRSVEPAELPEELRAGLDSRYPRLRIGALEELAAWLTHGDPSRTIAAYAVMQEIAANDIPAVAQAARTHLDRVPPASPPAVRRPRREMEVVKPAVAPKRAADPPGPAPDQPAPPRAQGAPAMRDMTQPRLLGGRYELAGVVGRGGMAEVYSARDHRLDRIVAVKVLRSDLARDQTFQARFRREAQSAASLNSRSIVAVYDTGEDVSAGVPVPYIVMEYVDGRTVRDLLIEGQRLLPERALYVVSGILRALEYSHLNGIVHRDIKPGNVMISRTGDVKVMDFGIARAMNDSQATMTQTAQVIGTAQYLSPEQARGERVDARSDIYSTGCVLYELLVGRPPFTGDSPVAIAYQHVRENPVPPSRLDPNLPAWTDAIVLRAMAKSPDERYQNAAEMQGDIQRAASGMRLSPVSPVSHQPVDNEPEGGRKKHRRWLS
jgi:tRNA A-37 threonylcarbamoyl transferase component Bud32